MNKLITIISLLWSVIPKIWPVLKSLYSWVRPKAQVIPFPNQTKEEYKKEIQEATEQVSQALDKLNTLSQQTQDQTVASTLDESEEKKSLEITGLSKSSKSFLKSMSLMSSNQASIIILPTGSIKNRSVMRTQSRLGSKLLL